MNYRAILERSVWVLAIVMVLFVTSCGLQDTCGYSGVCDTDIRPVQGCNMGASVRTKPGSGYVTYHRPTAPRACEGFR